MATFQEVFEKSHRLFAIYIGDDKYEGFFTNECVKRPSLPEGWHAYDIAEGDEIEDGICEIVNGTVFFDFYGTFLTNHPLPLKYGESLIRETGNEEFDYSFL